MGLRRGVARLADPTRPGPDASLQALIAGYDVHVGIPEGVIASLRADSALERVSDMVFQVHFVDPPHPLILCSIELIATRVAPALGWTGQAPAQAPSNRSPEAVTA